MKYLFYITSILLFVNCTPKVAEQVTAPVDTNPQAWRSQSPGPGAARPINMGESHVFTLENGLTVIVVENHKIPRVSYGISLVHEQPLEGAEVGYLGFAGQMLRRGTKNRTKAQLDQEIDFIGASLNTSSFGVNGSSLTKHQDKLLNLMTDVLFNPSFPEEEFEKIRTQTLSGIQANKTDPNAIAGNVAAVVNYGTDHPYGEISTEKTTNAIKLETCKNYYDTYFKPNNAYLTIVGDISPIVAKAKAKKYFGDWEAEDV
ncbi:MAG: insulinase family protein, partial [Bacteroidia bacterium]|nr:insulinase family protein [Bacteroidia bacterium]